MLLMKASLPIGERRVANYIEVWTELLQATGTSGLRDVQNALFAHLYENLNILDGKTNSLIQLNGVLIGAYVFIASSNALHMKFSALPLFLMGLTYAVVAVFLCLRVIWVHWSSRAEIRHPDAHLRSLIRVRTQRTVEFRRAWTFSAISICAVLILVTDELLIKTSLNLLALVLIIMTIHLTIIYVYDNLAILTWRRDADD